MTGRKMPARFARWLTVPEVCDELQITIEHCDGTAEHYATARDDAYALVLAELRNPTPGVSRVDIRPVTGAVRGGLDSQEDAPNEDGDQ